MSQETAQTAIFGLGGTSKDISELYAEIYDLRVEEDALYTEIINSRNEDGRAGQSQGKSAEKPHRKPHADNQKQSDDLSLPSSILGESPKVKTGDADRERTGELSEA